MKDYFIGQRRRNWSKVRQILAFLFIVLLILATLATKIIYNRALQPVSASQHNVLITVKPGATIDEIAKKLEGEGLIKSAWAFGWYVRNHNIRDRLQAGSYYLRPNQGVEEIVNALTQGKIATNLFTILPSQRLDQIKTALINNGGFSEQEVDEALKPENYTGHPALIDKPTGVSLEGYLYPESFQKISETKAQTLIRQSLDEMHKNLTQEIIDGFKKQGLTVHEGVTLASVVEREVSNPDDRRVVAQVLLLRLKQGMNLQSDVTAFYGALKVGQTPSVDFDSEYNTYLHPGLPRGPISNVSASSLKAVAFPADSDYLYFVSGDDGKTYFSHTVDEHNSLVAQHCKKLCN